MYIIDSMVQVKINKIQLEYQGKTVNARKLSVSSEVPLSLDRAWQHVKKPALLQFVAKVAHGLHYLVCENLLYPSA